MIYLSFDIGIKNLALCILRHSNDVISIIEWDIICLAESKKEIKGVNNIAEVLYNELDQIVGKLHDIDIKYIDRVIIENQPSNLNGIMKTIQHLIFSYFSLLRHWDKVVGEVFLINPSLKLQYHTYQPASKPITDKPTRSDKYRKNKSDSIDICSQYISKDDVLKQFFASHKKKDDLSDTCLQTVSYIKKSGASGSRGIEHIILDTCSIIGKSNM